MQCSITIPPQSPQGARLAGAPSALDLSFHPDLGLLAQRGRELVLQDDAATHPPWRIPLDRRPADRHHAYPAEHNASPKPFVWTQSAEAILTSSIVFL